jgi:hypothetical protein
LETQTEPQPDAETLTAQSLKGPKFNLNITNPERVLLLVLATLVVLFFLWAMPAYKKVVKDNETKTETIASLKQEIVTYKNKSITRTQYYPDGKIKSQTSVASNQGSQSSSVSSSVSTESNKSHEMTVTKRGIAGIGLGVDTDKRVNVLLRANILGPFGICGMTDKDLKRQTAFATFDF